MSRAATDFGCLVQGLPDHSHFFAMVFCVLRPLPSDGSRSTDRQSSAGLLATTKRENTMPARALVTATVVLWALHAPAQIPFDDRYTFRATHETGPFGQSFAVSVLYDAEIGTNGSAPADLIGWSYGLCHDEDSLTVQSVVDGTAIDALGLSFNAINESPSPGGGFTVAVVVDFYSVLTLPPGTNLELNLASYNALPDLPQSTELAFCNTLSSPAVQTLVVEIGNTSLRPSTLSGSISLSLPPDFSRGDCNADGVFDIGDVVFLLGALFPPTGSTALTISCREACNLNGDHTVGIADAIAMGSALFNPSPMIIPAPTSCGQDPQQLNAIDCTQFNACP